VPIVGDELVQAASDALAAARRELEAAEARALGFGDEASPASADAATDGPTDASSVAPRADPWRDTPPPPEDALDRRFGSSRERDPGAPPQLD
jgi:hypothetical protein